MTMAFSSIFMIVCDLIYVIVKVSIKKVRRNREKTNLQVNENHIYNDAHSVNSMRSMRSGRSNHKKMPLDGVFQSGRSHVKRMPLDGISQGGRSDFNTRPKSNLNSRANSTTNLIEGQPVPTGRIELLKD